MEKCFFFFWGGGGGLVRTVAFVFEHACVLLPWFYD